MYVALLLVAVGAVSLGPAAVTTEHGAMTTEHAAGLQHASPADVMYLFDATLSPHTIYIDDNQGTVFGPKPVNIACPGDTQPAAGICVEGATPPPGTPLPKEDYDNFLN